jgi:transcription initiation factor TFIID TATA-box-binding protein
MENEIEMVAVVVSLGFDSKFDLDHLHENLDTKESEYSPEEVHWLKTRFEPNGTYVAFYQSGKAMIAGSESVSEGERVAENVTREVWEVTKSTAAPDIKIENVVAKYSLGKNIRLEKLAVHLGFENIEYGPEQFPALIFRRDGKALLVFSSGKIVCTGTT